MSLNRHYNSSCIVPYSQLLKKNWLLEPDTIDLWFFSYRENWIDLQILSDDEIARANAFKFELHRQRFLYYRSMLRKILSLYTGLTAKDIKFGYTKFGKPHILNSVLPPEFNLSHSEEEGIIGITTPYPIGVDIEEVRQLEDIGEIATQHFSKLELRAFKLIPEIKKCQHFYRLWTCKEAFVKALGNGLSYPLNQFSVDFSGEHCSKISEIKGVRKKAEDWSLKNYFICLNSKKYMAAYAVESKNITTKQYLVAE